ncbi:MAG TPA: hypothetical protein VN174_03875 [Candidatus Methanoperedens sp.]|nr:hypothetical protein [Candidatus Methanoperedens sp.]
MTEKTNTLTASNFRFIKAGDNNLHFSIKTTGDRVVDSYCRECPIVRVCFGEKGNKNGSVRVDLDTPIVRNLSSEDAQNVPCGAGIEIIKRR